MSDLELTKLCAEAMGDEVFVKKWGPYKGHVMRRGFAHVFEPMGQMYDPLHDDAQAMALEDWLIERGYLHYEDGAHLFYSWPLASSAFTFSADFDSKAGRRRAIVECVSKMQALKPTDAGGPTVELSSSPDKG